MKDQTNVTVDIMNYILRWIFIIEILAIIATIVACGQVDDHKLSKDQKQILNLYAKEHLFSAHQYLYFKSVKKKVLLSSLDPPITPQDFKLPQVALKPGKSQRSLDTLFTDNELGGWDNDIKAYKQLKWERGLFPENVKTISEDEIPDYLSKTDIPPAGQDPVFIHYISAPFVFKGKSALMFSKKWSSGANVNISYLYFIKKNGHWKLEKRGALNPGY